jgi:hypothetical protein
LVIGLSAAWKAATDAQQSLSARNRALEIETANYRAATEELAAQIESLQSDSESAEAPVSTAGIAGVGGTTDAEELASTADVEGAIRGVIAQYLSGLESRNLAALKRVWPSLGGEQERAIRAEFENARTVQALLTDPQITINEDITTVTGVRRYGLETQDGQRLFTMTRTTITLRRDGGSWVIERIDHDH